MKNRRIFSMNQLLPRDYKNADTTFLHSRDEMILRFLEIRDMTRFVDGQKMVHQEPVNAKEKHCVCEDEIWFEKKNTAQYKS